MSQSIIRKNNRSKYEENQDDDYDHSRYVTPKRYRPPERPTHHDDYQNNLLYRKYPVIIGDFTLAKPSDDRRFYDYKPKNTNTSYIYRGTACSSEVLERAQNEIRQYAQATRPVQKKVPFMNQQKHYQSMLTLPTDQYRSATDDDLIGDYTRDSLYESSPSPPPPRRNRSCSALYTPRSAIVSLEHHDPYYFGEPEESEEEDERVSSEEERCIIFGSNSQPKSLIRNTIPLSSRLYDDESSDDEVIFQEVVDVCTSTDDLPVYTTPYDRQEIYPNPSFRSEAGVYRVSRQNAEQDDYEEADVSLFPTTQHQSNISASTSSSASLDPMPVPSAQQKRRYVGEQSDYEEEEEEEENLPPLPPPPESIPKLQRLPVENPMGPIPVPRDEYVPMVREPESSVNSKSMKSERSRRSFFNIFNRKKKNEDKSSKKSTTKKKK